MFANSPGTSESNYSDSDWNIPLDFCTYGNETFLSCECLLYGTHFHLTYLTLVLLNLDTCISCFANSVDPDQLASEEANWSGSALFAIKYANLLQQWGSSNLIDWKLEVGVAS